MPKIEKRPIERPNLNNDSNSKNEAKSAWKLSDKLFKLGYFSSSFTIEMAFRGIKIYGSTGSGKTSGMGRVIGLSYLEHGFGGLVLCAKADNDELNNWKDMAEITQRQNSIIHFGIKNKDEQFCFNILEFLRRLNPDSQNEFQLNIVTILKYITNNFKDQKLSQSDGFWDGVVDQYLTHLVTLTLSVLKEKELTFFSLHEVFSALNQNVSLDEIIEDFSQVADNNHDLKLAYFFFEKEFKELNEKTRSIVITAISSMLFKFNIGMLKTLFGGKGNITPNWIMSGAVIVINMPTEEYGEIGKISNILWKFAFQKATQHRQNLNGQLRPIFMWADEVQDYIHVNDAKFQATARSKWCASVFITQNRPGLRLALGGGSIAEDALKTLDSNLVNSVFHQNTDEDTNKYASQIFGLKIVKHKSTNSGGFWSSKYSVTESEKEEFRIKNQDFRTLKNGGKKNQFKVESFVSFPGAFLQLCFRTGESLDNKKVALSQKNSYASVIKNKSHHDIDFKSYLTGTTNK